MGREADLVAAAALLCVPGAVLAETVNNISAAAERIVTTADVSVSDGTEYQAQMEYETPNRATYVQRFPDVTMRFEISGDDVSVWRDETQLQSFPEGLSAWILGHQFHVQLFRFAEINGGIVQVSPYDGEGDCPCTEYRGLRSASDMGIEGYGLVVNDESGRAQRLFVHRGAQSPVTTMFDDWRTQDDREIPFRIVVDDGEQIYDFRFRTVEFG